MGNGTSMKLVNFDVRSLSILWHRKIRLLMRHTDSNLSIEVADILVAQTGQSEAHQHSNANSSSFPFQSSDLF